MSRHCSRGLLRHLADGTVEGPESAHAVHHLLQCARCRGIAVTFLGTTKTGVRPVPRRSHLGDAFATIVRAELDHTVELLKARSWWAEIRNLSPEAQVQRVRSTASLQGLSIFETILADARISGRSDPFLGESFLRTAWEVARLLPETRLHAAFKNDLRGQLLTVAANCRRLAADLPGAVAAIEEAKRCLAAGTGDEALEGELLSIHSSLCIHLGEFDTALAYSRRSVEIFRLLEDSQGIAHNSVLEANCLCAADRWEEAIESARQALDILPPEEVRLRALSHLISVECLIACGRPFEAIPHFVQADCLSDPAIPAMRLGVLHCAALLLDGLGCLRESEQLFRNTIAGFFELEQYKQGFVSLLTLFERYCLRGAINKAIALCEEAIAATSPEGPACNHHIRRAWEELLRTLRLRQLSDAELVQARQFLVRHWSNPASVEFTLAQVEISAARLERPIGPPPVPTLPPEETVDSLAGFHSARESYERQLIAAALEKAGGNLSEASRILVISRNTLKARMRHYGLAPGESPSSLSPDSPNFE